LQPPCHSSPASAQTTGFGSPQYIVGNAISSPVDTNTAGVTLRRLTYSLTGMTNAATMSTGTVWLSTSPGSISGALNIGQFINAGSNNVSTNFSAVYTNPPLYVILSFGSGTNTVGVQATYGP